MNIGRPKVEDKRDIEIRFRVSKEENEELEFISSHFGMDKSKMIRLLIKNKFRQFEGKKNVNK